MAEFSFLALIIVCKYHIFFLYLSVDGHLGCFPIWAVVNCARMNTGVWVSFHILISIILNMYPNGIAGLLLNF